MAGEDISQELVGNTGKTFADLGAELDRYIGSGYFASPHLYDKIVEADQTGTLARKRFELSRGNLLHIIGTNEVFHILVTDYVGTIFAKPFYQNTLILQIQNITMF